MRLRHRSGSDIYLVGLAELDVQAEVPAELHAVRFI